MNRLISDTLDERKKAKKEVSEAGGYESLESTKPHRLCSSHEVADETSESNKKHLQLTLPVLE